MRERADGLNDAARALGRAYGISRAAERRRVTLDEGSVSLEAAVGEYDSTHPDHAI